MKSFIGFLSLLLTLFVYLDIAWSAPHILPNARVGEFYEYCVAVNGLVEPLNYDWSKGDKPAGLTLIGPIIKGIPSESTNKPYHLELVVTDALTKSLSAEYCLSVCPGIEPLSIHTEHIPPFIKGEKSSFKVSANGGEGRYLWKNCKSLALPDGLILECGDNCIIEGNPMKTGNIHLKVTVVDESGNNQTKELKGQVFELPPQLKINTFLPPAILKSQYSMQLSGIGGYPPYKWKIKDFPAWIKFNADTGVLSGMPSRIGVYEFSAQMTDRTDKTILRNLKIHVQPLQLLMKFIPEDLPEAVAEHPYFADIFVTGAQGVVKWDFKLDNRPGWLTINSNGPHLRIRGTPLKPGQLTFNISVRDMEKTDKDNNMKSRTIGSLGPKDYLLVVNQRPKPKPVRLLTSTLPCALVSFPYIIQLAAVGGEGELSFFGDTSAAEWLTISKSGILEGIPSKTGKTKITVFVVDSRQNGANPAILTVNIIDPSDGIFRIMKFPEPVIIVNKKFSFQIPVTGGVRPYRFFLNADLPPGIIFDPLQYLFYGTPQKTGQFPIKIEVLDSSAKQRKIKRAFRIRVVAENGYAED